jgi:hypothetical protein
MANRALRGTGHPVIVVLSHGDAVPVMVHWLQNGGQDTTGCIRSVSLPRRLALDLGAP